MNGVIGLLDFRVVFDTFLSNMAVGLEKPRSKLI
jgi:hypothetical protein